MADVSGKFFSAKKVRTGVSPSSPGVIEGETLPPLNPPGGGLNSVGLTMPSAFTVSNSPLTSNGSLDVTGAGTISQYIRGDGTLETFPSLTGYVPYTGATQNVDLGEFGVDAGFVNLDTTPTGTPTTQGTIYWDDARSTAALIMNGTIQHIGQDSFFYVKNSTGSSINKGVAVRFDGTDGASGHLKIAPFLADGTYPSTYFMGVTAEAIGNGEFGQVMHFGELEGINTSDFDAGDLLYASTTVAGGFQTTAPVAPNNIVLIAAAINSKNNGAILVRPTYGSNINNDEGVKITTPTTGQLLQLQAGGLWENKTIAQVLGGTSSQFVKGDGSLDSTTYQNTADKGQPNGYASLDGNGKVPLTQINDALIGNVNFQGLWNASTNTPTLVDPPSSGTKGYYYIVSTGGTFAGITFEVGDWIISNGTAWGKVDNTDAVSSVFGRTGNVTASNGDYNTSQVTESGNLYYTDARSRAALSFAAGSGAYNSGTGVITIPTNNNQITNGAGYITSYTETDTLQSVILRNNTTNTGFNIFNSNDTYSTPAATNVPFIYLYNTGTTSTSNAVIAIRTSSATGGDPILSFDIGGVQGWSMGIDNSDADKFKIARSWVALDSDTRFSMLTTGEATFTSSVTASSIIRSGGTSSQYLMADGSVSTLSNPVTGTGNTNYITKFTSNGSTIANSQIIDNGTNVSIGTFLPTNQMLFQVSGQGTSYGTVIISSLNNIPVSSSAGSNTLFVLNTFSGAHASIGLSSNDADGQHHRAVIGAMKDPVGNTAGKLDFIMRTTADLYTTRATMLSNGNFGLGTETPNYKLDAVGTVRANIFTSSDSTSYQGLGVYNNTFIGAGNIASALIINDIDGARYAISGGGYSLTFSKNVSGTSWATGMEINATSVSDATPVVRVTNRLGVGKTPTVALDVNGAALISSTVRATSTGVDGTFADAYIAQYSVTNAEANAIQTSVSGSANLSGFRFQASNGNLSAGRTTIVDFLRDRQIFYGNVGINIAAPTAKIHAVNDTNGFVARFTGGATSGVLGGFFANSTTGFASIGVQSNHQFRLFTNDTDRLTVTQTGQVLIGNNITSSLSFVEINGGAATFGGGNGHLKVTSSSTGQTVLNISNSSVPRSWEFAVGGSASSLGAGTFYIYDNAADVRFTISTSGAARFYNTLRADTSVTTPEIFINGDNYITFNNERGVWGIRSRTTASTNNLGASLKNIILCGGGVNEGFAVMGYQFATTAFEVRNNGTAFFGGSVTATAFFESSDKRIKELIEDDHLVKSISEIKPKLYKKNGEVELGYYAQDFESILPSSVIKNNSGYLNLSYTQVHTAKIAALEAEVLYLKQQIKEIQNENN